MKADELLKAGILEDPQPGDRLYFDVNRWHTVTARHGDQLELTYQKRGLSKIGKLSMDIDYFRDVYRNCMSAVRSPEKD